MDYVSGVDVSWIPGCLAVVKLCVCLYLLSQKSIHHAARFLTLGTILPATRERKVPFRRLTFPKSLNVAVNGWMM